MEKKVILIDDHSMMRHGISDYLKSHSTWRVEYEGSSSDDLKEILEEIKINESQQNKLAAIVDLSFKNKAGEIKNSGFEIVKKIRCFDERFNIPCIIFSAYETAGLIERALSDEVGAMGYVTKTSPEKNLIIALDEVSSGKKYIQENLKPRLSEIKDIYSAFTRKEKELISEVSRGLTNAQVAEKMKISLRTVENYLSNLYDKTETNTKIELLEYLGLRDL